MTEYDKIDISFHSAGQFAVRDFIADLDSYHRSVEEFRNFCIREDQNLNNKHASDLNSHENHVKELSRQVDNLRYEILAHREKIDKAWWELSKRLLLFCVIAVFPFLIWNSGLTLIIITICCYFYCAPPAKEVMGLKAEHKEMEVEYGLLESKLLHLRQQKEGLIKNNERETLNLRKGFLNRLRVINPRLPINESSLEEFLSGTLAPELYLTDNLVGKLRESCNKLVSAHSIINRTVILENGKIELSGSNSWQVIADWDNELWWSESDENRYSPRLSGLAPVFVQCGQIVTVKIEPSANGQNPYSRSHPVKRWYGNDINNLPLVLRCRSIREENKPGNITIISNSSETRESAVGALESIALRAMSTFPMRKLQCIFVDPVSMGNTFPFKAIPEEIRNQRTYTTSEDIREQLHKLVQHTEQIIQNYLSREYEDIEEYNAKAEAIQESYRYLFIADFPSKFDSRSLEYLSSLLVNGARAGVYVVIHVDESIERARSFDYRLLEAHCQTVRYTNELYNGIPLFSHNLKEYNLVYSFILDRPPNGERFNHIANMIRTKCAQIKPETVPFSRMYPEEFWSRDSRKEIRTPIGITGAKDYLEFWLGQNEKGLEVSQSLLFGKPGAGKSYTLHSIVSGLAMHYSPEELEVYLLDFKEGVEFQVYIDPDQSEDSSEESSLESSKALPHAKVISIESDREFGLSVLRKVSEEFQVRANEWKSTANDITKLSEYRDRSSKKMPRILVVIDEFQVLFESNDSISAEINQIFDTIVKKGRAFGIHLLLASQSPNIKNITRSVYDLIDLRMAMQMNQNVASLALAEGNTDAIELLDRPGRIIYNPDFGRKGSNQIGQIADAFSEERKKSLRAIQSFSREQGYERSKSDPLVVFDGRRSTKLTDNGLLQAIASANNFLSCGDIKEAINESNWRLREVPSVAWLGESMKIGYHTRCIFRRRSRSNMLMIGSHEETIFGIIGGVLVSIACCSQPETVTFKVIDLSDEDDQKSYWSSMTEDFRREFSPFFPISLAKDFSDRDREIQKASEVLKEIIDEFDRRKRLRDEDPDISNVGNSIFLIMALGTLERFSALRPTVDSRGNPDMSDMARKLMLVVSQGSELGIHLILWMGGIKPFNQLWAGKERVALSHFDLRLGLSMPPDDSRTLFNETLAASLTKLRAYYKDEASATSLEKFKPYAVPKSQEIADFANHLKIKS